MQVGELPNRGNGNDEVGAKLMGFSDDINAGINGCHDAGTFLVGFPIQDLVSGSVVIDLTISSSVLLYDFNNLTDLHVITSPYDNSLILYNHFCFMPVNRIDRQKINRSF